MNTKNCFLGALFILVCLALNAQQVSIGLKGGVNQSGLSLTNGLDQLAPDLDDITSFNFGAVAELAINENFAVQSELLFTQKGFGIRQGVDANLFNIPLPLGVSAETRINYIQTPLLAKVRFGNDQFKGFLTAGPSLGYATQGKLVTKANVLIDFRLTDTPINLDAINFNRFEIGGVIGAGLSFDTSVGELFVEARYNHGFTQLYNIPLVNETLRNRTVGLSAGFMIPLN